jgi:hypothetical protein
VALAKEDAQGNTTPVTTFAVPKNGEKLRITPVFHGYGIEPWTPTGVRWEINILNSAGTTVLKQECPNPSFFSWNGADTNGTPVPAGQYTFSLFAFVPEATWAEYAPASANKLEIKDLELVPLKKDGTPIVEAKYPPNPPTFHPVGGEKIKITGTINISPESWTPSNLGWSLHIYNVDPLTFDTIGEPIVKTGTGANINVTWSEPSDRYIHIGSVDSNGNLDDITNPRTYKYVLQTNCENGIEPTQEIIYGQSVGFEIPVPQVDQNDPLWENLLMGYVKLLPMGKYGCLLASSAMVLQKFGIPATPVTINDYMVQKREELLRFYGIQDVFTRNGRPKLEYALTQYSSDNSNTMRIENFPGDALYTTVQQDLALNRPSILQILFPDGNYHALVSKGLCRGYQNFKINDPILYLNGRMETLEEYNQNIVVLNKRIRPVSKTVRTSEYSCKINFSAFSFNELSPPLWPDSPVNLSIEPVIELLVTDPLGRKEGYDFPTQRAVQKIPNSVYYLDAGDSSGPSLPKGKMLELGLAPSGEYTLNIIGTQTGGYILDIFTVDNTGDHGVPRAPILGIISPEIIHTYQIHYEQSDVRQFNVTKTVATGEIGESLHTAFSLNWIDNKGIFNSLNKKIEHVELAVRNGNINTAVNNLKAFINEVHAQSGKHIKKVAADIFISDAQAYIKQLQP